MTKKAWEHRRDIVNAAVEWELRQDDYTIRNNNAEKLRLVVREFIRSRCKRFPSVEAPTDGT